MEQNSSEFIAVSSVIAELIPLFYFWDGREADVLSPTAHPNLCSSTVRDTASLVWAPTEAINKVSSLAQQYSSSSAQHLECPPKAESAVLPTHGANALAFATDPC